LAIPDIVAANTRTYKSIVERDTRGDADVEEAPAGGADENWRDGRARVAAMIEDHPPGIEPRPGRRSRLRQGNRCAGQLP